MVVSKRKEWGTGPAEVDPVTLVGMARLTKGRLSAYIIGRRDRGIPAEGTMPWLD